MSSPAPPAQKVLSFEEMRQALKDGKKVRRAVWPDSMSYIRMTAYPDGEMVTLHTTEHPKGVIPQWWDRDWFAEDWVLYLEN